MFLTGCLADFFLFVFVHFLVYLCGNSLLRTICISNNWSSITRQHILRFVLLVYLAGVIHVLRKTNFWSNLQTVPIFSLNIVWDVLFWNRLILQILLNISQIWWAFLGLQILSFINHNFWAFMFIIGDILFVFLIIYMFLNVPNRTWLILLWTRLRLSYSSSNRIYRNSRFLVLWNFWFVLLIRIFRVSIFNIRNKSVNILLYVFAILTLIAHLIMV